jgi:carbon monoxide dehydrogenase subunit G
VAFLHEVVETSLPIDQAFTFVSDFSNSSRWDPGTAWSKAIDAAPPRVGARYELGVRMGSRVANMEYTVTMLEPNSRVVLAGSGSNVRAIDDIRFERTPNGTRIEYRADITLTGWLRLAAPFTGRAFAAIGRNARDGMRQTLDEMAGHNAPETERAA